MTQTDLGSDEVSELRREYRKRVNEDLPERAKEEGDWPIHLNHCFGRVVLDNLFGDEWYSHVDGRPAYQHLSKSQLRDALEIADRMLEEGKPAVDELNRNSLRWRGEL